MFLAPVILVLVLKRLISAPHEAAIWQATPSCLSPCRRTSAAQSAELAVDVFVIILHKTVPTGVFFFVLVPSRERG